MLFGFLGDFIRGDHFPVCTTYVSWLGTTPLTKRFSLVKTEGRKGDPDNYPDISGHFRTSPDGNRKQFLRASLKDLLPVF